MLKVPYLFNVLTDADIVWMTRVGVQRRLKNGETLIEQGKSIDSIVLVLEGRFSVLVGRVAVARRHVGDILGEMSMADSAPPSASIVADGQCLVLSLSKRVLLQKIATDTAFGCRFYKAVAVFLADRLREIEHPARSHAREELASENVLNGRVDNVVTTHDRFDRMMKILSGA